MAEKEKISLWMTKSRLDDLKILSHELDIPVSILIRMGASLIIQKYKKTLTGAPGNEKDQ